MDAGQHGSMWQTPPKSYIWQFRARMFPLSTKKRDVKIYIQKRQMLISRSLDWCFWTMVLEKTIESRLDCKEIHPVHSKGHQSWVFFRRTDAKAETPVLWPPDVKSWLIGKDSDAGRDWGQEEKGTEDEMAGWHHWLDGWVWVNSGSWWWTRRPGVLRFMGSQRVGHNWATDLIRY